MLGKIVVFVLIYINFSGGGISKKLNFVMP